MKNRRQKNEFRWKMEFQMKPVILKMKQNACKRKNKRKNKRNKRYLLRKNTNQKLYKVKSILPLFVEIILA